MIAVFDPHDAVIAEIAAGPHPGTRNELHDKTCSAKDATLHHACRRPSTTFFRSARLMSPCFAHLQRTLAR
jgi:hypothetical protein